MAVPEVYIFTAAPEPPSLQSFRQYPVPACAQISVENSGLLAHIREFLLELGAGFAFVGENVPLCVGGDDFFLDLLFYHLKLRAYLVIDLKMRDFKPEYAGKMNFYLSAVDDQMRHPDDQPSIGVILCKTKNRAIAEYALRDIAKPVGVSGFVTRLVESLPANLQGSLPTVAQLEAELQATPLVS